MSMDITEQLQTKAKANPKRVVFPEAEEPKILRAARQAHDIGIAYPMLVSRSENVSALARSIGVSLDGITVVDHTEQERVERFVTEYTKRNSDFPASATRRMLKDPLNFAAMMVLLGDADCIVAGLAHTTEEVIMASEMIIGLQEGISTVSSMVIASIPGYEGSEGSLLAFADCVVCPAPGPNELADIAISTADTVRSLMGWEPRVALLSFSTKGSAGHESVDKVLEALEMVHERRPDLLIDGELQLDSAIVPEVAVKKVPGGSPVAGKANILIFPDLNTANIGIKIIQRFAKGVTYGGLQGFAKPVGDLSRGSSVEEIVGAIAMLVVYAQSK